MSALMFGQWSHNLALIAAAPDLLAALKAYVENEETISSGEPRDVGHDWRVLEQARAAVAKAEGK